MLAGVQNGYRFGRFLLLPNRRALIANGVPVAIHDRAFDILVFLVEQRDRIVSRDEIFARVWAGTIVADNNLTVQICALRRVLSAHGADPRLILNVTGRGYRFAGAVAAITEMVPPGQETDLGIAAPGEQREQPVRGERPAPLGRRVPVVRPVARRRLAIGCLSLSLALVAWTAIVRRAPPDDRLTIAVEPFASSGGANADRLGAALTDAVATHRTCFGDLRLFRSGVAGTHARYTLSGRVVMLDGAAILSTVLTDRETGQLIYGGSETVPVAPAPSDLSHEAGTVLTAFRPSLFQAEAARKHHRVPDALDLYIEAEAETSGVTDFDRLGEAIGHLSRAERLAPASVPVDLLLSSLLISRLSLSPASAGDGDGRRALGLLDGVLTRDPDNVVALQDRAEDLVELGEPDAARSCILHALRLDPGNAVMLSMLADSDEESGRTGEAASVLATIGDSVNGGAEAQLDFEEGRNDDALVALDRYLSSGPEARHGNLMRLLRVAALARAERLDAARAELSATLAYLPAAFRRVSGLRRSFYLLPAPAWAAFGDGLRRAGMAP